MYESSYIPHIQVMKLEKQVHKKSGYNLDQYPCTYKGKLFKGQTYIPNTKCDSCHVLDISQFTNPTCSQEMLI